MVIEVLAEGGPFESMPDIEDAELLNGLNPFFGYYLLVGVEPILPKQATPAASPAS